MQNYAARGVDLNDQQRAAAHSDAPLTVIFAGAGAGKTASLIERLSYLVASGIPPERILALTFTRKAAGEMRLRAAAKMGSIASRMTVSTFDALAYRTLQGHPDWAARREGWSLWDERQSMTAAHKCAREAGIAHVRGKKGTHSSLADLLSHEPTRRRYEHLQRLDNALDFRSMEAAFLAAIRGGRLAGWWDHILVDEYQDTSPGQATLVRTCPVAPQRTAVGDSRQSIYAFRGAVPEEMQALLDDPKWTRFDVDRNYRSAASIVRFGNAVLPQWPGCRAVREDTAGDHVGVWLPREIPTFHSEVIRVADEVERMVRGGRAPGEIAVLARTWSWLEGYEVELRRRGIASYYNQRRSPFYTKGGQTIVMLLRLVVNRYDDLLAEEVGRAAGLADDVVVAAVLGARRDRKPVAETLAPVRDALERVDRAGARRDAAAAIELVGHLLDGDGGVAVAAVRAWVEARRGLGEPHGVQELVDEISQGWVDPGAVELRPNAVCLSTAHSAKGLEWPVVIVVGAVDHVWPSDRGKEQRDRDEEQRVFYVAVTRAMDRLLVCCPGTRPDFRGCDLPAQPSRLIPRQWR